MEIEFIVSAKSQWFGVRSPFAAIIFPLLFYSTHIYSTQGLNVQSRLSIPNLLYRRSVKLL